MTKKVGSGFAGYSPPLKTSADPANGRDLHESFNFSSKELSLQENDKNYGGWPSEPTGFREAYLDY